MTAGRLLVDLDRREEALVWYRAAAVDRSGYGAIATGQLGKLCGALGRHDEEAALVDEAGRRWWGLRAGSLRETTLSGVVEPAPSQLPVLAAHAVRCLPAVVFAVSMIGGQFLRRPTLALLPVSLVGACLIPALPLLALELWDPAWPSRLARLRASRRGGRGRRPRSRPGRSSG